MAGRLKAAGMGGRPRAAASRGRLAAVAALVLAVLATHAVVLEWLADQWQPMRPLERMADVMFTRTLQPAAPPEVQALPAAPAPRAVRPQVRQLDAAQAQPQAQPAPPPQPAAQASAEPAPSVPDAASPTVASSTPPASTPATSASQEAAPAAQASAAPAQPAASSSATLSPTVIASTPAEGSATGTWLQRWPTDTRLRYQVTGHWRGPITGNARVQWQRQGDRYQAEIGIYFGATATILSQGRITPQQLEPEAYEELMPLGRRRAIEFRANQIRLADGELRERPPTVQDTASQFVEMAYRFAHTPGLLQTGSVVRLTMARPGGIDHWVYDVAAPETLDLRLDHVHTPVTAYRLTPRPLPGRENYIYMQVWYSPQLQHLPVRIRVDLGFHNGHVQLDVIGIDQR